ncbi:hypothetical protein AQUSIP_18410 [Aquicella siphonis]|uniref:DUF1453 domain-containing protein n=1 Tax=Aquicella siphonis TaxID=254247 RepID=A0A5E4PIX5_9COXI|nr:hypothetical protein [Aquicella siphonis]VVC76525.1 hypothetical protein AQUSIP_18410 [Aquicella siphonis]
MPYAFWEAVAETPWWIYLLIFGIFYIAYRSTKPRFAAVRPIMINNGLMISFLFAGWATMVEINARQIGILSGAAVAGILIGWLHFRFSGIKAVKNKSLIRMPGSWILFAVILLMVAAKYYYFGYTYTLDMEVIKQGKYHSLISGAVGLIFGMFMGRMYYLLQCLKYGPYTDEK